ncbi:MAG: DUF448 domain-containing protein [Alphaproteobacteria bacterium]
MVETDFKKEKLCERKCIVTGASLTKEEMIRFVIDPKGEIIPDIYEKIDGRGFWVSASKTKIETAINKKLFAKASHKKVNASIDIIPLIEKLLKQKCLNLIGFSKKASSLIAGFEKVKVALKKREVYLLIIASNGKENGIKKISPFIEPDVPVINVFDSEELGHIIGKDDTVFIAIKKSTIAEKLFAEIKRFYNFIEKELNN